MERKAMLDADDSRLSIRQQCQLLKLNRSGLYYQNKPEDSDNVKQSKLRLRLKLTSFPRIIVLLECPQLLFAVSVNYS